MPNQTREADPTDLATHVQRYAAGILTLHESLRKRFAAELAAKEAHVRQLEQHTAGLSDGVTIAQLVVQKDEHISGLDAHIRALDTESGRLAGVINELHEGLSDDKDAHIAKLESFARETQDLLESSKHVGLGEGHPPRRAAG